MAWAAGQHINHGTAGAGGQIKSALAQFAPGHPLSGQESQAQERRWRRARESCVLFRWKLRDGSNRSQRRLPRDLPARQFHRDAAEQQQKSVDQQQRGGQIHLQPVVNIAAGAIVQRGQAPAHDVNAGERHEQHGAGHQADDQPQPGTAQALTVVGRAIAAAIAATAAREQEDASRRCRGRSWDP